MLSRVAENIYWMGRYLERAEDAARLVSVNTNLLLDLPKGIAPGWEPLIIISGSGGGVRMHEGILSLMQMAKVSAALAQRTRARSCPACGVPGRTAVPSATSCRGSPGKTSTRSTSMPGTTCRLA